MITDSSKWNDTILVESKASITKIVFSRSNYQITTSSQGPKRAVGHTTFSSNQWINKLHVKVTRCQDVLRCIAFTIRGRNDFGSRWSDRNASTFNRANAVFEIRHELWIFRKHIRERSVGIWKRDVFAKKFCMYGDFFNQMIDCPSQEKPCQKECLKKSD